jgi:hypothetical protein
VYNTATAARATTTAPIAIHFDIAEVGAGGRCVDICCEAMPLAAGGIGTFDADAPPRLADESAADRARVLPVTDVTSCP